MSSSTQKLVQISAILLTLTTTAKPLAASSLSFSNNITVAQSVNSNTVYSLPESLPSGTKIRLHGSNSMTVINRSLKQRYEEKFPDAQVELAAGNTSEVLEALLKGETEIAAIGRPLTASEKERGLVEVPIERGKIAVIVGPENPFLENLSFDQFAKILRGEVTNWSEIGGPKVPIRFIDRPEFSDTREALKSYDVFKKNPFQTGSNATQVSQDDTAAVIKELGKDGISYAIADQVINKGDVRIISMHKTLPDDPRYPYSQPRNYIYNKDAAPPEVLAFMGLVTSPVGKEVVATVDKEGETDSAISSGVTTTTNSDTAADTATNQSSPDAQTEKAENSEVSGAVVTSPSPNTSTANEANSSEVVASPSPAQSDTATNQSSPDTQTEKAEDSEVSGAVVTSPSPAQSDTALLPNDTSQETETGGFPWWLIFLLGIPLLGALIWGLQRGRGDDSAQTDTDIETFTPVDGDDSTGRARPEAGVDTTTSDTQTTTVDGNETTPTGGIGVAPIAGGLGVAGLLAAWANREKNSQIILIRQSAESGLATWFVPEEDQDAAKSLGGQQYQLRVYDVTDIDLDSQPAHSVQQYDCSESTTDQELDFLVQEHEYQAEIGYVTDDGEWLKLARSEKLRISEEETIPTQLETRTVDESESTGILVPESASETTTVDENETTPTDGIPIAPIAGGLGLAGLLTVWANRAKNSEITLTEQPNQSGLATWSVPEADKDAAKSLGGQQYQLRVYDVTDIDIDSEPTQTVQQYDCLESTTEKELDSLTPEHEYQAEIGYVTDDGEWLKLARSEKLRISAPETDVETTTPVDESESTGFSTPEAGVDTTEPDTDTATVDETPTDGIGIGQIAGGLGFAGLLAAWANRAKNSEITLTAQPNQTALATWSVPEADKDAAKSLGGQQYQLRVYDVTDIDLDSQPAHSVQQYDCPESTTEKELDSLEPEHEYQAEIGYVTDDGEWLKLARSEKLRISTPDVETTTPVDESEGTGILVPEAGVDTTEPDTDTTTVDETPTDGIGIGQIAGGLGFAGLLAAWANRAKNSEITLTEQPNQSALTTWSVPEADKDAAKSLGGQQYQLRVYDVTDIDLDSEPAQSLQQYDCPESTTEKELDSLEPEHEYQAEIGYVTDDGEWLKLARSEKLRISVPDVDVETTTPVDESESTGISVPEEGVDTTTPDTDTTLVDENENISTGGIPIAPIAGGLGFAGLLAAWANQQKNSEITLTAQPNQSALATWSVPEADKDAAKSLGGQQYQLRVYDVTDIDLDSEPTQTVQQYDCSESTTEKELDSLEPEHEYQAEIGYVTDDGQWLKLARSEKLRISAPETDVETTTPVDESESTGILVPEEGVDTTAPDTDTTTVEENENISTGGIPIAPIAGGLGFAGLLAAWANRAKNSEITLTAQPNQSALATWSVPEADKDAAKSLGGQQYQLRVYDVTDIDLDSEPAHSVQQYDCPESTTEKELDSLAPEHEYQAEIGYVTDDGEWLKLARSEKLRISAPETATPVDESESTGFSTPEAGVDTTEPDTDTTTVDETPTDGIGIGQIAGGLGFAGLLAAWANRAKNSEITLTEQPNQSALATWSVPEADKDAAKSLGGQQYQLRVYDVTDIDLDSEPAHSVQQYDCPESTTEKELDSLEPEHEYQAEIGYVTDDGQWLKLARCEKLRISAPETATPVDESEGTGILVPEAEVDTTETETTPVDGNQTTPTDGIGIGQIALGLGIAGLLAAWANRERERNSKINLTSHHSKSASATWSVPQADKDAAKLYGGQQYQLRVYDVTNIDLESQPAHSTRYYDSEESNQQWQVGNLLDDREYQAEIGYATDDSQWLLLARSNRVRISEYRVDENIDVAKEPEKLGKTAVKWVLPPCKITITPENAENMMVGWEVPQTVKNAIKEQGGEQYQLRIYDVTGIDLDTQPAYNVQAYDCEESTEQMQVPVFVSDRDYQAEIGYVTDEGEWLKLARSNRIRMPVPNFTVDSDAVESTQLETTPTTATIPEEALKSSWIAIVPHDRQSACVHLVVSQTAKDAAKQQGGQQYQLRIYDVTDVDIDSQEAQKIQQYDCEESIQKQKIPINTTSVSSYVDYLAEIGYVTDNLQWLRIACSDPLRIPVLTRTDDIEAVETIIPGEATIGTDVISQVSESKEEAAIATSNINPGDCEIQHLVVHSRNNCYSLSDAQIKGLQETAVSQTLEPGIYVMRIKSGTFGYGSNVCPSGEPFVLLWIFGGKVKNQKTNIPVGQTWSTLNGYQETLTLEVLETTTLYVFFVDTYTDDNNGELTVSVAKLYS
ncbi:MAG: DUF4912 domain-containing protein [Okeania sp. SIO3B5]|uniref:DUF4912 domain-containing protein n=1 Tax=Okeania sp. SIO3B5 TaxID=2607811 RepID=UPI0013FF2CB0|nr:DUF4912 domain-containing protein [Okeania sp. SIO3B5]NEO53018.1 DUF4912 domain-containing protein [Okeania sp. SIO3B5]